MPDPTLKEKLETVEEWGKWVAAAIRNPALDDKRCLVFRSWGTEPDERSKHPGVEPCPTPRAVDETPEGLAQVVTKLVRLVHEVKVALPK